MYQREVVAIHTSWFSSTSAKNWSSFEFGTVNPALLNAARSSPLSSLPLLSRSIEWKRVESSFSVCSTKVRNSRDGQWVNFCRFYVKRNHGSSCTKTLEDIPSYWMTWSPFLSIALTTSLSISLAFLRAVSRLVCEDSREGRTACDDRCDWAPFSDR